jgi:hypothetical protein
MKPIPPLTGPLDLAACPHPLKRRFGDQGAAQAWLDARPELVRTGNEPYRCPGGHWHYGHPAARRKRKRRVA